MSFEYLINKEEITVSEKIKSNLDELVKFKEIEFKAFNYDLSKLLKKILKDFLMMQKKD